MLRNGSIMLRVMCKARIGAAACDRNEGMEGKVLERKQRKAAGTAARKRAANMNILAKKQHS
jgi:hypothetical protein